MIKNDRYDQPMTTLGSLTTKSLPPLDLGKILLELASAVSGYNLTAAITGTEPVDLGIPLAISASITGWIHQDEDAHDTCSLTACLNPLHPGPCKGWKGTLHSVSPGAWHAIEAQRVEKANHARVKKIEALKAQGKPIPHKLLQPIVAKKHPNAGQTANKASGDAHQAGKEVTANSGVHPSAPGKVTLGQASKPVGPVEKGPKGKKPTLGSKGIAFVIGQEKVTPQYKLDKASAITPEQWSGLSEADQSAIRGELTKIKKDGFGPQQKKADELLAKLTPGAQPKLKGSDVDKIQAQQADFHKAAAEAAKGGKLGDKPVTVDKDKVADILAKAKAEPPKVTEMHEPPAPTSAAQGAAMKAVGEAVFGKMSQPASEWAAKADKLKAKGSIEDHEAFKTYVNAVAQAALKQATVENMPGLGHGKADAGITEFNHEIRDHIKDGKPGLPPLLQKMVDHHNALKADKPAPKADAPAPAKLSEVATPSTAVTSGGKDIPHTTMTPTNVVKIIQKNGSADLILGGEKIKVGFEGKGHPGKLIMVEGGHYKVTTTDGKKFDLAKGQHVKVADAPKEPTTVKEAEAKLAEVNTKLAAHRAKAPAPKATPKHVEEAIAMAKGQAPGASWSKNHLAAYQHLSAEEFHGLPKDVQATVVSELAKGQSKFLDPKKVAAAKALLEKFGQGDVPSSKPVASPKPTEVDFSKDLHNHAVTKAQAQKAVKDTPISSHFQVAKQVAGLTDLDNPDAAHHSANAVTDGQALVDQKTKLYTPAVLKDPAVEDAMHALKVAGMKQAFAQSVHDAKHNAYNKISMKLGGQTALSPIEAASLMHYGSYVLTHQGPATHTGDLETLKADTKKAENELTEKLQGALKKANTPAVGDMSNAQIADRAADLLGGKNIAVYTNLSLAELKMADNIGKDKAAKEAEKYPVAVLNDPTVAAKFAKYTSHLTQEMASKQEIHKLDDHIEKVHQAAILSGKDQHGNPLSIADKQVLAKHAVMLKQSHSHLDKTLAHQETELPEAKAQFHAAAEKAAANLKAAGPVTLSEYDQKLIASAYSSAWSKHASKATSFGVNYEQSQQMKANPQYASFTQDLGELKVLAGKLAVAHGEEHTAHLNVPTDPETGALEPGPELNAWAAATKQRQQLEAQFKELHTTAQARLDHLRVSVGLKKRALPKADAPAVKAAAAETGYYSSGGYSGPNYGKAQKAKNYMMAKAGPKIAVVHQTSSEKKLAKLTAPAKPGKPAPEMPAPKAHVKPPSSEAGKAPNAGTAASLGYHYTEQVGGGDAHGWTPGASAPAYVSNPDELKAVQGHLTAESTQFGLAAQKEFKWSINNMEGKGGPASGKKALYSYTGSGYGTVNAKLNGLPPGTQKTGSSTISSIDAAMAAAPPLEGDVVLYRGFSSPESVFKSGKWNDVNVAGVEWSQRSYSSTSGQLSTAQSFAGYNGVVMRVIIPKEMAVKGINAKGGQHAGENEIILERGLRYRVVADYGRHGNKRYIDVMVVPSPYDKPE
jgi:hypothetical protein